MKLDDIKTLIIDDNYTNTEQMALGLKDLDINFIYPYIQENNKNENKNIDFSTTIKNYAINKQITQLYGYIKNVIKDEKIDLLFLDLNLTDNESYGETTGEELIKLFLESDEQFLSNLPIVIVSRHPKEELQKGYPRLSTLLYIEKPTSGFNKESFVQQVKLEKLNDYWEQIVENYRKSRDCGTYIEDVKYIKTKLEFLNYDDKLSSILETVENINGTTLATKEMVLMTKILTQTIAKSLPKLTNKSQGKQLIQEWEDDENFIQSMEKYFPKRAQTLFQKINNKLNELEGNIQDDVSEIIYEQAISFLEKEADIENEDDKMTKYMKYGSLIVEKISDFVLKK